MSEKFNSTDRKLVINYIQATSARNLQKIGTFQKYLEDESGERYCIFGAIENWHGLPKEIVALEETSTAPSTAIIAMKTKTKISIFKADLKELIKRKHKMSDVGKDYQFNTTTISGCGCVGIRETSDVKLTRVGEIDVKEAALNELLLAFGKMSKEEQAKVFEALKASAALHSQN
jgi:hypothetical protein